MKPNDFINHVTEFLGLKGDGAEVLDVLTVVAAENVEAQGKLLILVTEVEIL